MQPQHSCLTSTPIRPPAPREISIGAADADVIRIGNSGSQVLLIGDVFVQDINNVAVQNKLADLNAGAPANSGSGVGFNVIENDVATGWFKTKRWTHRVAFKITHKQPS
jgi:hypothetical protein